MSAQPRESAVPCAWCGPRGTTWNTSAVCDHCARRVVVVPPLDVALRAVSLDG